MLLAFTVDWTAVMGTVGLVCIALITERGNRARAKEAREARLDLKDANGKIAEVKDQLVETTAEQKGGLVEVKETLSATTAVTDKKLDQIHTLVNSERGILLHAYMLSTRLNAELTKGEKEQAVAELAEQAYLSHEKQQKVVDAGA